MLEYQLLKNRKPLGKVSPTAARDITISFSQAVNSLLTRDMRNMQGTNFKRAYQSRELEFRGLRFPEIAQSIREHWPHMSQSLSERDTDSSGRFFFYRRDDRDMEVYVNTEGKEPIIVHLSGLFENMHTNYFIFYGNQSSTSPARNIVEAFSLSWGYPTLLKN